LLWFLVQLDERWRLLIFAAVLAGVLLLVLRMLLLLGDEGFQLDMFRLGGRALGVECIMSASWTRDRLRTFMWSSRGDMSTKYSCESWPTGR
jgi:hypothetical protein